MYTTIFFITDITHNSPQKKKGAVIPFDYRYQRPWYYVKYNNIQFCKSLYFKKNILC